MNDRVTLSISGTKYAGWESVEIVRGIDNFASTFSVTAAAKEDGSGPDFQFGAGAAVTVAIDGEPLITGYVDQVAPSFNSEAHSIQINGRDRTADLVDCSAVHKTGSWANASIEGIAAELAAPFGITVTAKASTGGNIRKFSLQQGETVHQAIERLLRFRGLLLISNPTGQAEIIAAKQSGIDWTLNNDRLLAADAMHDIAERFSHYIVKGQSSGDDENNGRAVSAVRGEAKDPAVLRNRPLIIIAEEQSTIAALDARAKWESTTRAAKAQSANLVLQGWRAGDGKLWQPNYIVDVDHPFLFIDSPMLISEVALIRDSEGTTTRLTCSPPEGWSQQAIPEASDATKIVKKGRRLKKTRATAK